MSSNDEMIDYLCSNYKNISKLVKEAKVNKYSRWYLKYLKERK